MSRNVVTNERKKKKVERESEREGKVTPQDQISHTFLLGKLPILIYIPSRFFLNLA